MQQTYYFWIHIPCNVTSLQIFMWKILFKCLNHIIDLLLKFLKLWDYYNLPQAWATQHFSQTIPRQANKSSQLISDPPMTSHPNRRWWCCRVPWWRCTNIALVYGPLLASEPTDRWWPNVNKWTDIPFTVWWYKENSAVSKEADRPFMVWFSKNGVTDSLWFAVSRRSRNSGSESVSVSKWANRLLLRRGLLLA